MLWDQTSQRVDDRSVADLLVELAVWRIPFVRVDFHEGLHEELRPKFHQVAGSGENWHFSRVTRDPVVDFNQTLLSHETQLDPVLAARREAWQAVLLGIDSLPDELLGVNVTHVAVLGQLELGGHPFSVRRHAEAKIETILDRHAQELGLVGRICLGCLSFGSRLLLLLAGLVCLSFLLLLLFSATNFFLRLQALKVGDYAWVDFDLFLVNMSLNLFVEGLELLWLQLFLSLSSCCVQQVLLSYRPFRALLLFLLCFEPLMLLLRKYLAEIFCGPQPMRLIPHKFFEARRQEEGLLILEGLLLALSVRSAAGGVVVVLGFFVARPFGELWQGLVFKDAIDLRLSFHADNSSFARRLRSRGHNVLQGLTSFVVASSGPLFVLLVLGRHCLIIM